MKNKLDSEILEIFHGIWTGLAGLGGWFSFGVAITFYQFNWTFFRWKSDNLLFFWKLIFEIYMKFTENMNFKFQKCIKRDKTTMSNDWLVNSEHNGAEEQKYKLRWISKCCSLATLVSIIDLWLSVRSLGSTPIIR